MFRSLAAKPNSRHAGLFVLPVNGHAILPAGPTTMHVSSRPATGTPGHTQAKWVRYEQDEEVAST
jgi:hypothetical protein